MKGRMLAEVEQVLLQEEPDALLVYGDTNSTLAGSLAAAKLHIPVAHVEAGLRSFNRNMPEEINRILTDHISEMLFVPTDTAEKNLLNEGIEETKIQKVGDVMLDAALHFGRFAEKHSTILEQLNLEPGGYVLATVHRAENTDFQEKLTSILSALAASPLPVVIPLHPRTRKKMEEFKIVLYGNLRHIDTLGFLDMIMLEKNARKIATDSGGVQKEAYFYEVPCITLREETEWVELVEAGVNTLAGSKSKKIMDAINNFSPVEFDHSFYGSGDTARKIVEIWVDH